MHDIIWKKRHPEGFEYGELREDGRTYMFTVSTNSDGSTDWHIGFINQSSELFYDPLQDVDPSRRPKKQLPTEKARQKPGRSRSVRTRIAATLRNLARIASPEEV